MKRTSLTGLFVCILKFTAVQAFAQESAITPNIAQGPLRDIKGPVIFPSNMILLVILIAALLAGAFVILRRFINKKEDIKEEMPLDTRTPWEIAYDQFDKLEKSSLLEDGQFKAFYSQLSGIIRQYFENHFRVRAPEMTTEEFLWSLEKEQDLSESQKNALKNFLASCDIVKFAKHIPGIDEGRAVFKFARELVYETKGADEPSSELTNNK